MALTRTPKTTTTTKIDEFVSGDWTGNFSYSYTEGEKPNTINVNGNKGTGGFTITSSIGDNSSVAFYGIAYDPVIVDEVLTEIAIILDSFDTEGAE